MTEPLLTLLQKFRVTTIGPNLLLQISSRKPGPGLQASGPLPEASYIFLSRGPSAGTMRNLSRFVVNDQKAWLYVPDEKTIYLYEAEQIISSPIVVSFFSGLGQLGEMFSISQLPTDPGPPALYRLELLPRESESPVSRVTLWVSTESYYVIRIQTEDPLGNINEVSLTNIQVDIPLEPSWFALEVPNGVRVEKQEASPR